MTVLKLLAGCGLAFLTSACGLHRHADVAPSEGCAGHVEITTQEVEGFLTHRLLVRNDSTNRTTNATRLNVSLDDAPYPVEVSSPAGWTAFIRLCSGGRRVCGIEWQSCPGLVPGMTLEGFAVRFAANMAPRILGWSLDVGECQVGGISGVLSSAPGGRTRA